MRVGLPKSARAPTARVARYSCDFRPKAPNRSIPVPSGSPAPLHDDWHAAAPGSERCLGGFLHVLDLPAQDAADWPDAFDRLRTGALQAIVVHQVVPAADAAAIVQRLERHDPAFLQSSFPRPFKAWFYGRNVNLADPALTGYFEQARVFNAQLADLATQGVSLPRRVSAVLSALDRGRRFVAAPGPTDGDSYMFTTIRAHLPRGYIPAHFDNEMRLRPSYRHLSTQVDAHIASFVLTLDPAEGGGALEVFDLRCATDEARLLSDDRVHDKPDVSTLASVRFRLPPGSMIVLDSGRYLHRVTPVEGARTRWTACSFMALGRDGAAMQCWG